MLVAVCGVQAGMSSSDDGEVESDSEEELDDDKDSEDELDSDSEAEPTPVAKPKRKNANGPKEAAKAVEPPTHKPRREGAKLRREEEKEQDDDDDPSDTDDAQDDDDDEIVLKQDGREVSFTVKTFAELHLSRPLLRACQALGYDTPTPIQSAVVPLAMGGRDVCGSAKTGSGKTAAFMLPLLERLMHRNRRAPATRVLVLVPTRELAVQVSITCC
jgi:ATP-dependent RNA helicase DDX27